MGQQRTHAETAPPGPAGGEPPVVAARAGPPAAEKLELPFAPSTLDLLALIGDGLVATDDGGRIILFNAAAEDMFGYSSEEVTGRAVEMLLPQRFRRSHRQALKTFGGEMAATTHLMGRSREVVGLRGNGEEFFVEATLSRRLVGGRPVAIAIMRDVTERKLLEERRRLLSSEVAHRMKNNIAVINSIVSLTARSCGSVATFKDSLQGRLMAMADSNELLLRGSGKDADLEDLLRVETAPFLVAERSNILLEGPKADVSARLTVALGLVIHELATNSAKYGAFSRDAGQVRIGWSIAGNEGQQRLLLAWREENGPPVTPPVTRGFGTELIEHSLRGSFRGKVDITYPARGLECRIDVSLT